MPGRKKGILIVSLKVEVLSYKKFLGIKMGRRRILKKKCRILLNLLNQKN
jgi:hypothetical protein